MSENSTYQLLRSHLAALRLSTAAEALPGLLEQAKSEHLGDTATIERLLGLEVAATEQRRRISLERFASLPAPWRLSDFDFDAQPSVDRSLVNDLGTLRFVEDATNVLFIGPPGVGKKMLAVGLARLDRERLPDLLHDRGGSGGGVPPRRPRRTVGDDDEILRRTAAPRH